MTLEADQWLDIDVRPAVPGAQIERLNQHLTSSPVPAMVNMKFEGGNWSYEPNEKGEFQVRLHVPSFRGYIEEVIKHNAFEVVRVIQMPEGVELEIT